MDLTLQEIDWHRYLDPEEAGNIRSPAEYSAEAWDVLQGISSGRGAATPWGKLNDHFQLRRSEFSVWAGQNGSGKSLLTSQFAVNLTSQNRTTVIFSPEMTAEAQVARLVRQTLGQATPTKEQHQEALEWLESRVYLYVRQDAPPEDELIGVMRFCRQELSCYLFVVDSLMKAIPGTDDYNRQKNFCNRLAMESRDSGIHIALVAHTRKSQRDIDTQDRMDIRGAGEISDLADAVGILNRNREQERKIEVSFEKDYKPTEPHAFLRIAKQRHGSGWEGNIGLYFDQASQTFLDTEGQCPVSHLLCGETRPSESKETHTKGHTVAGMVPSEVREGSF